MSTPYSRAKGLAAMLALQMNGISCLHDTASAERICRNRLRKKAPKALSEAAAALRKARVEGFDFVPLSQGVEIPDDARHAALLPDGIFVCGDTTALRDRLAVHTVAVAGTRDASPYGVDITRRVVAALPSDATLVAAFGLGIAHAAILQALEDHRPVIALMGSGAGDVYPQQMAGLYARLLEEPGCTVVTPFAPGTAAMAFNFIVRSHLEALASEIIVTEARERGASMVTARLARSFGREVFAAPGRIGDSRSVGCNSLIEEGTARILKDVNLI